MKTDLFILLDTATEKQLYFQKPASQNMEMLIDLHNDIFLLLIFICTIIIVFLILILAFFKSDNFKIKHRTKQSSTFPLNDLLKKLLILFLMSYMLDYFTHHIFPIITTYAVEIIKPQGFLIEEINLYDPDPEKDFTVELLIATGIILIGIGILIIYL
jgi:heme/copper-type cytochrome/quinol oxidase subunit 2